MRFLLPGPVLSDLTRSFLETRVPRCHVQRKGGGAVALGSIPSASWDRHPLIAELHSQENITFPAYYRSCFFFQTTILAFHDMHFC